MLKLHCQLCDENPVCGRPSFEAWPHIFLSIFVVLLWESSAWQPLPASYTAQGCLVFHNLSPDWLCWTFCMCKTSAFILSPRNDQWKLSLRGIHSGTTARFQTSNICAITWRLIAFLPKCFIKIEEETERWTCWYEDNKNRSHRLNTRETKLQITRQNEDRESFTLIRFSLALHSSIVYSINCEEKEHN